MRALSAVARDRGFQIDMLFVAWTFLMCVLLVRWGLWEVVAGVLVLSAVLAVLATWALSRKAARNGDGGGKDADR